jgi:hypothetical protein
MLGGKVTLLYSPKNKVNGKQVWVGIYVIKIISKGLGLDMIFTQLFVCFLSPCQGSYLLDKNAKARG